LGVAALLLVSPHSQVYTFVWALIPLIVVMSELLKQERSRWLAWLALGVAYLLIGREFQLYLPGVTRFVQSHYLFGALLLWGLVVAIMGERRGQRAKVSVQSQHKRIGG